MTYVTENMRSALAEHKLTQVCNSNGVRVFRMGTPHMGMDLVFLPDRIGITGVTLGDVDRGLWSESKHDLGWFASNPPERRLCAAFYRQVWAPSVARDTWARELVELVEQCDGEPTDAQRLRISRARDLHDGEFSADEETALYDIWLYCFGDYPPESWGYDYEPVRAGWLCAIQQRFAELYREREARIEAVVAGWGWIGINEPVTGWFLHHTNDGPTATCVGPDGRWLAGHENGTAETVDAAKLAARAAVLRQAKEHPALWHCGAVDE